MSRLLSLPLVVVLVSSVGAQTPHPPGAPPVMFSRQFFTVMPACPGCGGSMAVCTATCACCTPCAGLIKIMDTTKDADTFMMAVAALPALEKKGCQALPAVVRNAERLGLLKGLCKETWTPAQHRLMEFVQQINAPTDGPPPPVGVPCPPVCAYPPAPCANYGYAASEAPRPSEMVPPPPACSTGSSCPLHLWFSAQGTTCPSAPEKLGPPRAVKTHETNDSCTEEDAPAPR